MKAALLSINLENPGEDGAMYSIFEGTREEDGHEYGPIARCWALKRGIEADWPDTVWAVVGDAEAEDYNSTEEVAVLFGISMEEVAR